MKPFALFSLPLAIITTQPKEGQAKPQDLLLTLLEQSSLCMVDECCGWVFYRHRNYWTMSLALSFGNHLFNEEQWKSHLFSGSQARCQRTQSTDEQSCAVCATAALITSIMERICQGGERGAERIKKRQQLYLCRQLLADPSSFPLPSQHSPGRNKPFSPLTPGTPELPCQPI